MVINKTQLQVNNNKFSLFNSGKFIIIYLYNNNYSIIFRLNKINTIKIISSKTISIKKYNHNINLHNIIQKYIKQINSYNYAKIKFSGKGYKIKKNNNKNIILLFNRAHITQIWWRNIILKKLKKYKMYIKYTNNNSFIRTILFIRNINIFTKKGLRLSKQILFKKKGKK